MAKDTAYIVTQRRPYQWLLFLLFAVTVTIALQWLINQQLNAAQRSELTTLQQQNTVLHNERDILQQQNQQLLVELNDQQQMLAMSKVTDQQLRSDLEQLQNKVIELNKELLFYQNITQGTASSELQIRELHLSPVNDDHATFHYRIVLTQGKKINQPISGTLTVNLALADKKSREIRQHAIKFRHVQVVEGAIQLNENESPSSLLITLKQGKKTLTERDFDWSPQSAESL